MSEPSFHQNNSAVADSLVLGSSDVLVTARPPTEAKARALEEESWSPGIFQKLSSGGRTVLMEVCNDPRSVLTDAVQQACGTTSAASRCALWNACDAGTPEGLTLIKVRIRIERPQVLWLVVSPKSCLQSPATHEHSYWRTIGSPARETPGGTTHVSRMLRSSTLRHSTRVPCGVGNA